jgi:hypothetical protein
LNPIEAATNTSPKKVAADLGISSLPTQFPHPSARKPYTNDTSMQGKTSSIGGDESPPALDENGWARLHEQWHRSMLDAWQVGRTFLSAKDRQERVPSHQIDEHEPAKSSSLSPFPRSIHEDHYRAVQDQVGRADSIHNHRRA